jgi:hypothetical protein
VPPAARHEDGLARVLDELDGAEKVRRLVAEDQGQGVCEVVD